MTLVPPSRNLDLFALDNLPQVINDDAQTASPDTVSVVKNGAKYWHYGCDGDDDRG